MYQCLPINAVCGGFWKVDIDKMGSDLARRPSEKAPRNCDSSGSEKSNDSSRINGVCNSGLNCKTPPGQFSVQGVGDGGYDCRKNKAGALGKTVNESNILIQSKGREKWE